MTARETTMAWPLSPSAAHTISRRRPPSCPDPQAFRELNKPAALAAVAREMWQDAIESDRAIDEPGRLVRFLLLTFADLKKSSFLHWFAFPSLGSQGLFRLASPPSPASSVLRNPADAAAVLQGLGRLRGDSAGETGRAGCPPFFVVSLERQVSGAGPARAGDANGGAPAAVRVMSLRDFEEEMKAGGAGAESPVDGQPPGSSRRIILFGFVDPSSEPRGTPGSLLRNFLALLSARWGLRRVRVLCFREYVPRATPSHHDAAADSSAVVDGEYHDWRRIVVGAFWTWVDASGGGTS